MKDKIEEIAKIIEMHTVRYNVLTNSFGSSIHHQDSSLDIARDIYERISLLPKADGEGLVENPHKIDTDNETPTAVEIALFCGFYEGSKAQKALDNPLTAEWISVSDRLPEGQWSKHHPHLSEEVLVANSAAIDIAYYDRSDGTWYVGSPADKEWIDKIRYWMPLPRNPFDLADDHKEEK